jgi:hypothetical protein
MGSAHRDDPLERAWHRRLVVLATALVVLVGLVSSAVSGSPSTLPGIALGSPALLHLERSLVAGAATAGALIFILRGWAGYFPSKLSTSGAEYGERPSLADLSELSAAVADLRSSYMDTAQATREVLEHVAGGTNDKDDML